MSTDLTPSAEEVKRDLLQIYPTKVARKRAGQIVVNSNAAEEAIPEIAANVRTTPGIISQRGCCYAGCKGVVLGPTRDIVNLVHGPIGCSFYAWLTRRNQTRPPTAEDENFMTYCFSTDMHEEDIEHAAPSYDAAQVVSDAVQRERGAYGGQAPAMEASEALAFAQGGEDRLDHGHALAV